MAKTKTAQTPEPGTLEKPQAGSILERARKGDSAVLPELRGFLDQYSGPPLQDLVKNAEHSLVKVCHGEDLFSGELTRRQMDALRAELAGAESSPLERLLIDRIVVCWGWVMYCETTYAQRIGDMSPASQDFHQRRLDRVHRRYLTAIKALAQVRKLQLPAVQLNVAARQINLVEREAAVVVPKAVAERMGCG